MSGVQRFGNYFLLKKIATGGMAELYKAKKPGEKGFEKLLAIKMILPHLAASDEFISMFIDEAKVAALLNHQNIVQIYDLGRIEDSYCIVMEYVRGKDLRTVVSRAIKNRAPIKLEHACLITANTLSGLSYAHRKMDKGEDLRIVHRDISPQNILISYEGEVKIVDFGIAKAATQSRDTQAGVLKGKISYMSPEQAMGRQLDMRSDVFSTGVVLYELITGKKLFSGDTDLATLEMVRAARVEPLPSNLSKSFPPELEAILLKALAKEPDSRYQTAAEMEAALLDFMRSAGYSTSGYSLSEYMYRLFKEEIEHEMKEEREIDRTVAAELLTADTVAGQATPSKAEAVKTPPAGAPRPAPARQTRPAAAARPAGRKPKPRKSRAGGLLFALIVVVGLIAGGYWAGPRIIDEISARQSAKLYTEQAGRTPAETAIPDEAPAQDETLVPSGEVLPEPDSTPGPEELAQQPAAAEPEPAPEAETEPAEPAPAHVTPEPASPSRPAPILPASAEVSSEPAGAEVYVDGNPAGRTPVIVSSLEPNVVHGITLKLAGHKDWTGTFRAGAGGTAQVKAVMDKPLFGVEIDSVPPGARVFLDGADTGKNTPARLDSLTPGRAYALRLELDGFKPHEETVRSGAGGTVRVAAKLVAQFGELTVNSTPWAQVSVDGEDKGTTPLAGIRLGAGEHEVVLDNPKLNLKKRLKVRIKPDETTRVVIDLGKN